MPGVGTVAALADSGLYAAQGDYVDAGLSLMGVISGGELLGKAGEALHGAAEVAEAGADVVKAGEQAEHVVATGEKIEQGVTEGEKALDGAEAVESDASNAEDFASCPTHSFSSDTQVATPGGSEAISSLKVGDQVQAYDPKTGVTGPHHPKALSWRGVGSESCRRRR